ncbi:MAG: hypothetical protein IPO27_00180 [Bacteroidetes bacterium]|nr:hypothetical protein [Bacteroidota bacterium]
MKKNIFIAMAIVALSSTTAIVNAQWQLNGNAGTDTVNNFIGTTDNRSLRVRTNNQVRMHFDRNGRIGIGTTSPQTALDLYSAASATAFGIRSDAGSAFIFMDKQNVTDNSTVSYRTDGVAKWQTGTFANNNFAIKNLVLGNAITCNETNNFVGIGTATPAFLLDVQGSITGNSFYNLNSIVNYVGTSDFRAIYAYSKPADGYGYGVQGTGGWYGGFFTGDGGAYTGSATGVYGYATGSAGIRYGVYGFASNTGGAAWAGYFAGNTYATNMVVNYSTPSAGYALTVGGKIICTEVRVQLTPFPDYVFDKSYNLNTIEEVEQHIQQYHRLPGMPSACEVEEGGMAVGEMQAKIVEKVEEQTLYIIQLNNKIKELEKKIEALERN